MRTPAVLLAALLCLAAVAVAQTPPAPAPPKPAPAAVALGPLAGAWQSTEDKTQMLRFADGRMYGSVHGTLAVFRVIARDDDSLTLLTMGVKVTMKYQVVKDELRIIGDPDTVVYARMKDVPDELKFRPFMVGDAVAVPDARVKAIQKDLAERMGRDQRARRAFVAGLGNKPGKEEVEKLQDMDAENTAYLERLVAEVGWIDSARFGEHAAQAAFALAQHSIDLPFMNAILPEIKKEVTAGKLDAQAFAMLYDRVRLTMGDKQRYGTQLGRDAAGAKLVVLASEDKTRVDQYRKEIGLGPVSKYLEAFKVHNNGEEVGFAETE